MLLKHLPGLQPMLPWFKPQEAPGLTATLTPPTPHPIIWKGRNSWGAVSTVLRERFCCKGSSNFATQAEFIVAWFSSLGFFVLVLLVFFLKKLSISLLPTLMKVEPLGILAVTRLRDPHDGTVFGPLLKPPWSYPQRLAPIPERRGQVT